MTRNIPNTWYFTTAILSTGKCSLWITILLRCSPNHNFSIGAKQCFHPTKLHDFRLFSICSDTLKSFPSIHFYWHRVSFEPLDQINRLDEFARRILLSEMMIWSSTFIDDDDSFCFDVLWHDLYEFPFSVIRSLSIQFVDMYVVITLWSEPREINTFTTISPLEPPFRKCFRTTPRKSFESSFFPCRSHRENCFIDDVRICFTHSKWKRVIYRKHS